MSYHQRMMNAQPPRDSDDFPGTSYRYYKQGHRDARHACAEIANEADADIQRLRTQLAESEAARAGYRAALEKIAKGATTPKDASPAFLLGDVIAAGASYVEAARQALESNPGKAVGDVIAAAREVSAYCHMAVNEPDDGDHVDDWRKAQDALDAALAKLEGRE